LPKFIQKLSTKAFGNPINKSLTVILILGFTFSCAQHKDLTFVNQTGPVEIDNQVIQSNTLLTKIYEGEIKPLGCIEDKEEAELFLRTLASRFDIVSDDYQSRLDDQDEIKKLINNCESNCTCDFLEELLKENEIDLTPAQSAQFKKIKFKKMTEACTAQIEESFCQSQLFRELEKEKDLFKYDE
jgi:hypothetical protein